MQGKLKLHTALNAAARMVSESGSRLNEWLTEFDVLWTCFRLDDGSIVVGGYEKERGGEHSECERILEDVALEGKPFVWDSQKSYKMIFIRINN